MGNERMKLASFILIASTMAPTPGLARCKVDMFRWVWGQDASASAHIVGGGRCKLTFSTGRSGGMASIAITTQAKHGKAATNGSVAYPEVTYVPGDGFKGADEFVFTVTGGNAKGSGASNIRVAVDAQ